MKEYEIYGHYLVERLVPLKEQYARGGIFRRIKKDGHLMTIQYWGPKTDGRHSKYELVSIWHPLDPSKKCLLRNELAKSGKLQQLIKLEIQGGGTVRDIWKHWLAVKPEFWFDQITKAKAKVAEIDCLHSVDETFEELLQRTEDELRAKGYEIEEVTNEFEGVVDNLDLVIDESVDETATEQAKSLEKELEVAKKNLKEQQDLLKKAKSEDEKMSAEMGIKIWQDLINELSKKLKKLESKLVKEKIKPEVEKKLSTALKKVLEENKELLTFVKTIKIKPTLPTPQFEYSFKGARQEYIVVLEGMMPEKVGTRLKLSPFRIAIEGVQPAAEFVANLHNAFLHLKDKAKGEVKQYLNSIKYTDPVLKLRRQHYIRDIKGSPGKYTGMLANFVAKLLPTEIKVKNKKIPGWTFADLLIKGSEDYASKIEKLSKVMKDKKDIKDWLESIGYENTVEWIEYRSTDEDIDEIFEPEEE